MKGIDNFVIKSNKENFLIDYKYFLRQKHIDSLKKLSLPLLIMLMIYFVIKTNTNWILVESICFGLIVFISYFVLFRTYELIIINKKLKKISEKFHFGKINLTIEPTQIELNQYGRKKIIFLSQLRKCILIKDTLFFIENKDYLPIKANKTEMSEESFDKLIRRLKSLRVKIE